MATDSIGVSTPGNIHKTITLPKRKPGRPRTNDLNIEELAKHAVIRELRRGNGRVGLAVLEALGVLKPLPEQSNILESAIVNLLPTDNIIDNVSNNVSNGAARATLDNVYSPQPIQAAKKPSSDGDISAHGQNFSVPGLTPADTALNIGPPPHTPESIAKWRAAHPARVEPDIDEEP